MSSDVDTLDPRTVVPTHHWHTLDDGRVQCDVCPRFCKMHDGQRGMCFVRANHGNAVVLTTYGRSSGFCVDPIEKKPLNHFLPGTPVLSFGTAGCNLACSFCQNWDISKSREMDTLMDEAGPETIARAASRLGCKSVAYTYNDPVVFMEYAIDVAKACKEQGVASVAVTAGYMTAAPRREFYEHMDAANVDLKGFTEDFYWKITSAHLAPVLETLEYLKHETSVWFELTTLLIPGLNDSDQELTEMCQWVVSHLGPDVPMHFTAFHPDWRMRDVPPTPAATLTRARRIAIDHGVRYAYTGNVHDEAGQSTYCHQCGATLIGRDGYVITAWHLDAKGACERCGTVCAGVFEPQPGHWGARRQPIRLATGSDPIPRHATCFLPSQTPSNAGRRRHDMRPTQRLTCALVLAGLAVFVPGRAWADIRLTGFGGATHVDDANKRTLGAAITLGGLIGVEGEASRTSLGGFKGLSIVDVDAHLTTFMANAVVRLPSGPLQPYGSAGIGLVRVTGDVTVDGLGTVVSAKASDVAWNIGGGLYLLPTPNFGLRADVRHFQTGDVSWDNIAGLGDLPLPKFDFWRATVGVTLKF